MSYGIQILNANGIVQVDQNYANMEVVNTGSVVSKTPGEQLRIDYNPIGESTSLVFVRNRKFGRWLCPYGPYPGGYSPGGIWPSGPYCYFMEKFIDYHHDGGYPLDNDVPVREQEGLDYVVIQPTTKIHRSHTYGLQVYNDAGQVVFDSNRRYLNIVAGIVHTVGDRAVTYTLPPPSPGRRYYFLLNQLWITAILYDYIDDVSYNLGYMATFLSDTELRINSRGFLNFDLFGVSRSEYSLSNEHQAWVLVAEF